jgi:glycerol-3-phosphate dehydrogenase (NAD(P)+)
MSKVVIIGSGTWGTALGNVLADNGQRAVLLGRDESTVRSINRQHRNIRYFPETELNPRLEASLDWNEVRNADAVLLAVPSQVCAAMAEQLDGLLDHPVILINVAKGFDPQTHQRLSVSVTSRISPQHRTAYTALLGPSHAEEVIQRMLTTVNVASENEEASCLVQQWFSNDYFRVYRNDDLIGCEYASGLKNIIALASGMLYGLNGGDNAKASLMTRGLAEMTRFGVALGAQRETFMGLCGMGDLIVTCTSRYSRNWQAGYQIGRDDSAAGFWASNTKTVEGTRACQIIRNEAQRRGIPMPITEEVYQILYEGQKPSLAIGELMKRPLRKEVY